MSTIPPGLRWCRECFQRVSSMYFLQLILHCRRLTSSPLNSSTCLAVARFALRVAIISAFSTALNSDSIEFRSDKPFVSFGRESRQRCLDTWLHAEIYCALRDEKMVVKVNVAWKLILQSNCRGGNYSGRQLGSRRIENRPLYSSLVSRMLTSAD